MTLIDLINNSAVYFHHGIQQRATLMPYRSGLDEEFNLFATFFFLSHTTLSGTRNCHSTMFCQKAKNLHNGLCEITFLIVCKAKLSQHPCSPTWHKPDGKAQVAISEREKNWQISLPQDMMSSSHQCRLAWTWCGWKQETSQRSFLLECKESFAQTNGPKLLATVPKTVKNNLNGSIVFGKRKVCPFFHEVIKLSAGSNYRVMV